jgi:hypothetical protein
MSSKDHPYLHLPDRSFWSRSVSAGWNARCLISPCAPVLRATDRIMSAGSCFAANIIESLKKAGYAYIQTEFIDETYADRFGYSRYSAAYGNIYTPRHLLQLIQRVRGSFKPAEDRWYSNGAVIDPFRPGLSNPAQTDEEFDVLTAAHLARTREAIAMADVFILTLGLTEAWISSIDGAVFPACPGTVAGAFDSQHHQFKNFDVGEIVQDLGEIIDQLRAFNSQMRVVLTVSPVPLVATATDAHVVCATTYSKSVLRVACEEVGRSIPRVTYFPAYEIIVGPHAENYFEEDRRSVKRAGIEAVVDVLFANSVLPSAADSPSPRGDSDSGNSVELSHKLVSLECEEMMMDAQKPGNG